MKKAQYFLLGLILALALVLRLYKIDSPIADWHSWRQADTASVSKIYVERGVDLLRPRYHDLSNIASGYDNPDGWRFVEFPIYNAVHAYAYKLYPQFSIDKWGRLVSSLFSLGSVIFIFLIGRKLWSPAVGLASAFFFAALPFNVYFSRVVLPEPAAVFFAVAGLWFFVRFVHHDKLIDSALAGVLFCLAILVKPFTVFYGVPMLYMAIKKWGVKGTITHTKLWVFLGLVVAPFFFWRAWMWSGEYLRGIPHWKWAFNGDNIRFKPAFWWWIFEERIGRLILGVWLTLPFVVSFLRKGKGEKYPYFLHALGLGQFAYLATIATASVRHDYYQTLIIPAVAIALGVGSVYIWNLESLQKQLRRLALVGLVALSLFFSFYQTKEYYKINHPEIITAGQAVDKLLPKDAKIIAPYLGDTAFLYQTGRVGWPYIVYPLPEMIERLGAQYYVSVNFDHETNKVMNEYKVLEKTDKYVIVDLRTKNSGAVKDEK